MRLKNTSKYPDAEVRALVEFATRGVNMTGVQVNIKNTRWAYRGRAYLGVPSCSPAARLATVNYLVTASVGPDSEFPTSNLHTRMVKRGEYPWEARPELPDGWDETIYYGTGNKPMRVVHREPVTTPYGGKGSPLIVVYNWREALVKIVAHEARHIYQFKNKKPLSEVDAEKFAAKTLDAYRAGFG